MGHFCHRRWKSPRMLRHLRKRHRCSLHQFFDRTSRRERHTFFGEGICAHIAFGEPISHQLRELVFETASDLHQGKVHNGGTYVNMDVPGFSV